MTEDNDTHPTPQPQTEIIGLHDLQPGDTISRGRTVKVVRDAWTEGDRSFVRFL